MAKRSPLTVSISNEERYDAFIAEREAVLSACAAAQRKIGDALASGGCDIQAQADRTKAEARLRDLDAGIAALESRMAEAARCEALAEEDRRQEARRLALTELQSVADEVDAVFRVLDQKVKVLMEAITKANAVCDGETRRELAYGGQSFKYHLLWHVSNMPGCTVPYSAKIPPFRDRFPAPPAIEQKG